VQYVSGVRIKHRKGFLERARGVWSRYREVKQGLFGIGVVIAFLVMAAAAPLAFPYYPGVLARVGPNFAAPAWTSWLDPKDPPTGNYLPDGSFESNGTWILATTNATTASVAYNTTTSVSGHRSIQFTLTDNSTTKAPSDRATAIMDISWPYKSPTAAFIRYSIKAAITGNMTGISIAPYFTIELPPGTPISSAYRRIEIHPAYPTTWSEFDRNINLLLLIYGFVEGTNVKLELSVEYKETNPAVVGTADFWFDDVQLIVISRYWGLLGTSDSGQDVMAQLFWGAQISLYVGLTATFWGVLVGLLLGLAAGYFGGAVDELTMRVCDFFLIMPGLPIMMILSAILAPSLGVTVFVISIFAWPGPARIIRSQVLVEKEKAYIEAARASGAGDIYLVFRHILPNVLTLVFVQIATGVSGAILSEAGLSFLGLTPQNLVSWGRMLQAASGSAAMSLGAWWFVVPPGLCIALLSMGFVFIGYAVDTALNPRLRKL